NQRAPTQRYTLSLHDALPIYEVRHGHRGLSVPERGEVQGTDVARRKRLESYSIRASEPIAPVELLSILVTVNLCVEAFTNSELRSEEHTSELQSRFDLVCRLL